MNVMDYFVRPLLDERPFREPKYWSILRTSKFPR
jgi:hypothetical protein